MKAEALTPGANVSQALTKGACPICGILKDFQWTLVETTRPQSDLRVCNFHGWALARSRAKLSRSTPGESVTTVFLEMLKPPLVGKVNSGECTLCHRVVEEEINRLRELAQKLQGTMFAQWMKSQGTLCLEHSRKVKEFVPLRLRTLVDEIVERNRAELQQELESFLEQLKHGIHEGGGLLGRAAEFLVGQRGL
jgi:tRNA/tmRNA/rRNA uracil-C5-methylase (TrmA/RlmC/RlmD family)